MAVVHGDRIKESTKLNQCSLLAFLSYALFVDLLPDDFGRFRVNAKLIAGHLAPRRSDVTPAVVNKIIQEYIAKELVRTWVVDGETFGEFTGHKPRGNRFHRTPEPRWSKHRHQGACLHTAISRAREWGDYETAERLSNELKELRERKQYGGRTKPERGTPPPSLPSPSFTGNPPSPPLDAGGTAGDGDEDEADDGGPTGVAGQVQVLVTLAAGWGLRFDRPVQRQWRSRLKAGVPITEIRDELECDAQATSDARAQTARTEAAWSWINAQDGGRDGLAREISLRLQQLPDHEHRAERAAWALERGAPEGVVIALIGSITAELTRLRRRRDGDPEQGGGDGGAAPAAPPALFAVPGGRR